MIFDLDPGMADPEKIFECTDAWLRTYDLAPLTESEKAECRETISLHPLQRAMTSAAGVVFLYASRNWADGLSEVFEGFDRVHKKQGLPLLDDSEEAHYADLVDSQCESPGDVMALILKPLLQRSRGFGLYFLQPDYIWDTAYLVPVSKTLYDKWLNRTLAGDVTLLDSFEAN